MSTLAPILSVVVVLMLSLLITRTATIALTFTGLSRESARFQARSAFTGVGFTTSEAESVVQHPVRRRILMLLMLLGNAGIVTVISSLVITFGDMASDGRWWLDLPILAIGLAGVIALATSSWVERHLAVVIERALKQFTDLDVRDYEKLLHLSGEYSVVELLVEPDKWLTERSLQQLALDAEGCLVLGIRSGNGAYLGVPHGDTVLHAGDVVMIYGRVGRLQKIGQRCKDADGEECRRAGIAEQERAIEREEAMVVA